MVGVFRAEMAVSFLSSGVGLKVGIFEGWNFWAVLDSPGWVGDCLWVVLIACCDALDSTNELSEFFFPL